MAGKIFIARSRAIDVLVDRWLESVGVDRNNFREVATKIAMYRPYLERQTDEFLASLYSQHCFDGEVMILSNTQFQSKPFRPVCPQARPT